MMDSASARWLFHLARASLTLGDLLECMDPVRNSSRMTGECMKQGKATDRSRGAGQGDEDLAPRSSTRLHGRFYHTHCTYYDPSAEIDTCQIDTCLGCIYGV